MHTHSTTYMHGINTLHVFLQSNSCNLWPMMYNTQRELMNLSVNESNGHPLTVTSIYVKLLVMVCAFTWYS